MSDEIVPALDFGTASADRAGASGDAIANALGGSSGSQRTRRTLDLRRTEAPGLGDVPARQRRHRQRRRYAVVLLDSDGRLTDQQLFSRLGWSPGTRVDIGVGEGNEIVVRRDEQGAWALTARNMVLLPAPLRRWCGYEAGSAVLVVAVPSMSAVVLHTLETLDQALPDPRKIVERMRPAGTPPGTPDPAPGTGADDRGYGERTTGPATQADDVAEAGAGSGDGHE